MKVLKVIHGFPPDYMAGSEVYSYHLVKALMNQVEAVAVYTGVENEFAPQYETFDEVYDGIVVHRINKFRRDYRYQQKYYDAAVEQDFGDYLQKFQPDVVHFGHLSHLSTSLIELTTQHRIPIIYTVHDFWLFCVKGQLINQENAICDGPNAEKCHHCSPYETTTEQVQEQLSVMRQLANLVDVFLTPSHTLRDFFIQQGVEKTKLLYSRYGFNTNKITYRQRKFTINSRVNFGFMGRIIPSKGIRVLIDAFKSIDAQLSIYGEVGNQKRFLQRPNIQFRGAYDNNQVNQVLTEIDVLIVPSIWLENSPLVIQEAFLAGIPVITSNIGGMAELVTDGVNGFLFEAGDADSLLRCIHKIIDNPILLNELTVSSQDVRSIEEDAMFVHNVYQRVLES